MGKINTLAVLKRDYRSNVASVTVAFNSSRIRSIQSGTDDVNGVSTAGLNIMYDPIGDNTMPIRLFCSGVLATVKTAIAALTTTNQKSIDLTVIASTFSNYPSGPNITKNFPIEFFVEASPHPDDSADSLLTVLSEDRKSFKVYRVDQTPAAIVALANA